MVQAARQWANSPLQWRVSVVQWVMGKEELLTRVDSSAREPAGWSPYLAGSLAGLLIVVSAVLSGNYFGASSTFVRYAAAIENLFSPGRVSNSDYFIAHAPGIDWQWMFVAGIFLGSLLSSATSRSFRLKATPDMWIGRFGHSAVKRASVAFIGGAIAMFGARLADG